MKENCSLCDLAHEMMRDIQEDTSFELEIIDITKSPDVWEAYREMIPVIEIRKEILWGRIDESELREFIFGKM
jgi:hypothetical protein